MSQKKYQHTVPRFYLKGFVNDNTIAKYKKNDWDCDALPLWVYSKNSDQIKEQSIKYLLAEKHYYSFKDKNDEMNHTLEDELSKLEYKFSKLLDLFKEINERRGISNSSFEISDDDRYLLAEYLEWQIKRVPVFVDEISNDLQKEFSVLHQSFRENISNEDLKSKTKKYTLGVLKNIGESGNIKKVLFERNICIFIIKNLNYSAFITTDNPVSVYNINRNSDSGLIYNDTEILFPLNKQMALFLYKSGKSNICVLLKEREKIKKINLYIAHKLHNYIIGCSEHQLKGIVKSLRNYKIF
jgi:hypothetical protein